MVICLFAGALAASTLLTLLLVRPSDKPASGPLPATDPEMTSSPPEPAPTVAQPPPVPVVPDGPLPAPTAVVSGAPAADASVESPAPPAPPARGGPDAVDPEEDFVLAHAFALGRARRREYDAAIKSLKDLRARHEGGEWFRSGGKARIDAAVEEVNQLGRDVLKARERASDSIGEGLVAWWKFDEGTGARRASDSSGRGNDATVAGNVSLGAAGRIGRAARFDGGRLIVPGGAINLGGSDFTFAVWLKTTTPGAAVMAKGNGDAEWEKREKQFYLCVEGGLGGGVPGAPAFVGHSCEYIMGGASVTDGAWHHVAWTWDSRARRGVVYVDGRACNEKVNYRPGPDPGGARFFIGHDESEEASEGFRGSMDDARLYGRALIYAEVAALAAGP
ncbi:MAG: LamG domain-containing protein [Planctomycetota bacterium]|jgi:hypothetical protein